MGKRPFNSRRRASPGSAGLAGLDGLAPRVRSLVLFGRAPGPFWSGPWSLSVLVGSQDSASYARLARRTSRATPTCDRQK